MGMASSDDDAKIIAEAADLQEHLDSRPAAERLEYERMDEDQRAFYAHDVKERYVRRRARHRTDR